MRLFKRLRQELVRAFAHVYPIRIQHGLSAGMRLYGHPFYNRRSAKLNNEELLYRALDLDGAVVVEAGANLGFYTLYFGRRVGRGRVVAFEPNPVTHGFLRRSIARNRLGSVETVQAGLANKSGEMRLVCPRFGLSRASFEAAINGTFRGPLIEAEVPVTTIDAAVAARGLGRVDFVKIDTEGFEPEVIAGMRNTLRELRPRVYFEIHGNTLPDRRADLGQVVEMFAEARCEVRYLVPGAPRITADNLDAYEGGGFLAVPEEDPAADRLLAPWTHREAPTR